jgi:hypothetical protein
MKQLGRMSAVHPGRPTQPLLYEALRFKGCDGRLQQLGTHIYIGHRPGE